MTESGAPSPTVVRLDPTDAGAAAALRSYWEAEQAAQRADRTHPLLRSWAAFEASLTDPSPYYDHHLLAVLDGGQVVAGADLILSTRDNLHLGGLEIDVRPQVRRRGLGRALHDEAVRHAREAGRTTLGSEVLEPDSGGSAATRFAVALGYASRHIEDHLVLDLATPAPTSASSAPDPDYEVLTWTGHCPEELRDAYLAMRNQMNLDVPTGEVDHQPLQLDAERLAIEEERSARAYDVVVAAARHRGSGVLGGYSKVYLAHGEAIALQDDTLVMPDHRGHRLGGALKAANHAVLAREHADRTQVHTWTDPDNAAMYRINAGFGYRPVERMHEMELRIG